MTNDCSEATLLKRIGWNAKRIKQLLGEMLPAIRPMHPNMAAEVDELLSGAADTTGEENLLAGYRMLKKVWPAIDAETWPYTHDRIEMLIGEIEEKE